MASKVTSLVIAGNSISMPLRADEETKSQPRTPIQPGHYPTLTLDNILADVASTMHIHLLPGASIRELDPDNIDLSGDVTAAFKLLARALLTRSRSREKFRHDGTPRSRARS